MKTGLPNIQAAFEKGRAAYMPYLTLGHPTPDLSLDLVEACANAGADLMELGIPFSDPLADGPTVQHSTQVALDNGMTVAKALAGVRELRSRGVAIPFMLMGYYNPILAYGVDQFVEEAAESGADGFIIPDLPPDEAARLREAATAQGLGISFLLSPNSPEKRIQTVLQASSGFVYLVSVLGTTGARQALPSNLAEFIQRARNTGVGIPLAVGFGISTPEQAGAVGKAADGVIVGSALLQAVDEAIVSGTDAVQVATEFTRDMISGIG